MQDTPKNLDQKRADEKMLVSEMIALYCRRQHKTPKGSLCPECRQLHDYALTRIDKCPFMETKTFCSACKVHCYKPEMRERIRDMRMAMVEQLAALGTSRDFSFVARQRGMFSYSGLTCEQVERLRNEFAIYAVGTGRICVAALNRNNLDAVTRAIAKVI